MATQPSKKARIDPGYSEPKPLETIACTFHGLAIAHGLERPRQKYLNVNVRAPGTFTNHWSDVIKQECNAKLRLSLQCSEAELEKQPPSGTMKCMLVGLALVSLKGTRWFGARYNAQGTSIAIPAGLGIISPSKTSEALAKADVPENIHLSFTLVVARIKPQGTELEFGVLLCPQDGLCSAFMISEAETFYFDEFRNWNATASKREERRHWDTTTTMDEERRNWSQSALVKSCQPREVSELDDGYLHHKSAAGASLPIAKSNNPLADNLRAFISTLSTSKGSLEECSALCQSTLDELTREPPPYGKAMEKFIDTTVAFGDQDARNLVAECKTRWPDMDKASLKNPYLHKLRIGLLASEENGRRLTLPMLRGFIAEGVFRVKDIPEKEQWQINAVVIGLLDTVKRIVGPSE